MDEQLRTLTLRELHAATNKVSRISSLRHPPWLESVRNLKRLDYHSRRIAQQENKEDPKTKDSVAAAALKFCSGTTDVSDLTNAPAPLTLEKMRVMMGRTGKQAKSLDLLLGKKENSTRPDGHFINPYVEILPKRDTEAEPTQVRPSSGKQRRQRFLPAGMEALMSHSSTSTAGSIDGSTHLSPSPSPVHSPTRRANDGSQAPSISPSSHASLLGDGWMEVPKEEQDSEFKARYLLAKAAGEAVHPSQFLPKSRARSGATSRSASRRPSTSSALHNATLASSMQSSALHSNTSRSGSAGATKRPFSASATLTASRRKSSHTGPNEAQDETSDISKWYRTHRVSSAHLPTYPPLHATSTAGAAVTSSASVATSTRPSAHASSVHHAATSLSSTQSTTFSVRSSSIAQSSSHLEARLQAQSAAQSVREHTAFSVLPRSNLVPRPYSSQTHHLRPPTAPSAMNSTYRGGGTKSATSGGGSTGTYRTYGGDSKEKRMRTLYWEMFGPELAEAASDPLLKGSGPEGPPLPPSVAKSLDHVLSISQKRQMRRHSELLHTSTSPAQIYSDYHHHPMSLQGNALEPSYRPRSGLGGFANQSADSKPQDKGRLGVIPGPDTLGPLETLKALEGLGGIDGVTIVGDSIEDGSARGGGSTDAESIDPESSLSLSMTLSPRGARVLAEEEARAFMNTPPLGIATPKKNSTPLSAVSPSPSSHSSQLRLSAQSSEEQSLQSVIGIHSNERIPETVNANVARDASQTADVSHAANHQVPAQPSPDHVTPSTGARSFLEPSTRASTTNDNSHMNKNLSAPRHRPNSAVHAGPATYRVQNRPHTTQYVAQHAKDQAMRASLRSPIRAVQRPATSQGYGYLSGEDDTYHPGDEIFDRTGASVRIDTSALPYNPYTRRPQSSFARLPPPEALDSELLRRRSGDRGLESTVTGVDRLTPVTGAIEPSYGFHTVSDTTRGGPFEDPIQPQITAKVQRNNSVTLLIRPSTTPGPSQETVRDTAKKAQAGPSHTSASSVSSADTSKSKTQKSMSTTRRPATAGASTTVLRNNPETLRAFFQAPGSSKKTLKQMLDDHVAQTKKKSSRAELEIRLSESLKSSSKSPTRSTSASKSASVMSSSLRKNPGLRSSLFRGDEDNVVEKSTRSLLLRKNITSEAVAGVVPSKPQLPLQNIPDYARYVKQLQDDLERKYSFAIVNNLTFVFHTISFLITLLNVQLHNLIDNSPWFSAEFQGTVFQKEQELLDKVGAILKPGWKPALDAPAYLMAGSMLSQSSQKSSPVKKEQSGKKKNDAATPTVTFVGDL